MLPRTNFDNSDENWKKIPGDFDKEYFINKKGEVRRYFESIQKSPYKKAENCFRYMKPSITPVGFNNGYLSISLAKNGRSRIQYIHRLLAITFIPNPENKPQVNHIDGNSLNNDLSNLEWATAKENIRHAWAIGLCTPHGPKNSKGSVSNVSIEAVASIRQMRKEGMTMRQIAKLHSCSMSLICKLLNNKIKTHAA
jgi:hypothetical protein